MLNSVSDLHNYIDKSQLTEDLGGTLEYRHSQWINHRTVSTNLCALFSVPPGFLETGDLEINCWAVIAHDYLTSGRLGFLSNRHGERQGARIKARASLADYLHLGSFSGMGVLGDLI